MCIRDSSSASLWQYVVRNVVSIFLVGLLALLLLQRFHTRLIVPSYHARLAGILLTSLSVGWMVFVVPGSMLLFLLIPLGALVAYGTEPRTTAWHTLGVSAALVGAALGDNGPLNHEDLTVEATMVQAIVLVLSIVSMSLVLNREEHARLLSEVEASRLATLSQAQPLARPFQPCPPCSRYPPMHTVAQWPPGKARPRSRMYGASSSAR